MHAEIVTPLPHVGFEIDLTQLPFIHRRLVRAGVRMSPGTTVTSGADGAVRVASVHAPDPAEGRQAIDAVVVSDLRARIARSPTSFALPSATRSSCG